ncbi:hypothetical protein G7046_g1455 [Stylonectria norvegica]|nr:hypothetical protein G7046_g1455 [Stylonectria norvegica]
MLLSVQGLGSGSLVCKRASSLAGGELVGETSRRFNARLSLHLAPRTSGSPQMLPKMALALRVFGWEHGITMPWARSYRPRLWSRGQTALVSPSDLTAAASQSTTNRDTHGRGEHWPPGNDAAVSKDSDETRLGATCDQRQTSQTFGIMAFGWRLRVHGDTETVCSALGLALFAVVCCYFGVMWTACGLRLSLSISAIMSTYWVDNDGENPGSDSLLPVDKTIQHRRDVPASATGTCLVHLPCLASRYDPLTPGKPEDSGSERASGSAVVDLPRYPSY